MQLNSIKKFPLILYLSGFIFVLIEFILHLYGKAICTTEGCRVVESFVKGGDIVLLIAGIVLFGILTVLSLFNKKSLEIIHSLILGLAIVVEGYLLGFQLFIIHELCLFCLIVFLLLFTASTVRVFQGKKELAFALAGFVAVLFITYLVNPQIAGLPFSQYVLVYSKDCPHCEEVIKFCKQYSISVETVEAKKLAGILKALNLNSVPVLFCDEGSTKKFIIGEESIRSYLLANAVPKERSSEGVCPIFAPQDCK